MGGRQLIIDFPSCLIVFLYNSSSSSSPFTTSTSPSSSSSNSPLIIASLLSSAQVGRLHWDDVPFERLEVSSAVAEDIFRHDEFKTRQIPFIVDKSRQRKEAAAKAAAAAAAETDGEKEEVLLRHPEGTVSCYRLGDHVDISSGKKQSN